MAKNLTVGNAVLGVPTAEGGNTVRFAGTMLTHRTRRNAGDGVPYRVFFILILPHPASLDQKKSKILNKFIIYMKTKCDWRAILYKSIYAIFANL